MDMTGERRIPAPRQKVWNALNDPQVRQRLQDAGAEAMPTTPEAFARMLHAEIAKWTKVVRTADIKVDG